MKANESHTELLPLADLQRYLANPSAADEALLSKVAASQEHPLVADALAGYGLDPGAITVLPPAASFSAGLAAKTGMQVGWQSLLWRLSAWLIIGGAAIGIGFTFWPKEKPGTNAPSLAAENTTETILSPNITSSSNTIANSSPDNVQSETQSQQVIPSSQETTPLEAPAVSTNDHGGPMPMEYKAAKGLRTTEAILKDPNLEVIVSRANSISKGLTAVIVTRYQGQKYADYASLRTELYYPLPNDSSVVLSYDALIKQAMDHYREKRFQQVLDLLSPVFVNYPNDVNVQLLTGLALQGVNDHYNAERWLGFASVNKISAFKEQAMYNRAQSLRLLGREEEARTLFQKVADIGGEYQKAAWTALYKTKP